MGVDGGVTVLTVCAAERRSSLRESSCGKLLVPLLVLVVASVERFTSSSWSSSKLSSFVSAHANSTLPHSSRLRLYCDEQSPAVNDITSACISDSTVLIHDPRHPQERKKKKRCANRTIHPQRASKPEPISATTQASVSTPDTDVDTSV